MVTAATLTGSDAVVFRARPVVVPPGDVGALADFESPAPVVGVRPMAKVIAPTVGGDDFGVAQELIEDSCGAGALVNQIAPVPNGRLPVIIVFRAW